MNENVIQKFYTCFQKKDWPGMQSCYHNEIIFSDPVFQNLTGPQAKAMWHMLTTASKDLAVTFQNARADEGVGACDWEAQYTFSRSGNRVHNVIHAEFQFRDGKIIRHTDTFNLTLWAGMALGLPGKLFGWTPFIQTKIRKTAASSLAKFITAHPEYQSR